MDERPIKNAELHLYARLAKTYIHYDRVIICEDGKQYQTKSKAFSGYGGNYPSFRFSSPKNFLKNRKYHGFEEGLDIEKLKRDIVDVCLPFQFNITAIKFYDSPFICPKSGIAWQPYTYDSIEYNSHYNWKALPQKREEFIVCEEERDVYDYISRS
jgi:hypothetical protein